MEEEKKKVQVGGRGLTPYKPDLDDQAYSYCMLGATDEELARFFGVSNNTICKWKKKYPSFGESIRAGKLYADMNVAKSLYKKAIGYSYLQVVAQPTEVMTEKIKKVVDMDSTFLDESNNGFQILKVTTKEVIPDTKAQIFWLKNRQPKHWREKHEVDHTTDGEKMSYVRIFELPNDGRND